jgi:hypothetical protein
MRINHHYLCKPFERGVVILSLDTEQMWGYSDLLTESQFLDRYPGAPEAHERLLKCLQGAGISATWFVVGGLTLFGSDGAEDRRMVGLPEDWTVRIPSGDERTAPLWYRHSFVEHLRDACPPQEIGLHGGLTHLMWTDACATRDVVQRELSEGIKALKEVLVQPRSLSFGREQEAYHELLVANGIRGYRGRTPVLASRLGQSLPGALLRILDELRCTTPCPVWPHESMRGLWNIPSSLFLYPIGPSRTRVVGLRSRVQRFRKGVEAAARYRGIFHFCLHPENLTESPDGFSLFEEILEDLVRSRERGDVEIATVGDVAARMQ